MPTRRSSVPRHLGLFSLAAAMLAAALSAQAQDPDQDGPERKVGVRVALQVGGTRYDAADPGVCLHTVGGAIYDVPADSFSVRHSSAGRRVNLTVWQAKTGGDMLTLHVSNGTVDLSVDTVRARNKLTTSGSGSASVQAGGAGGTFTINAVDAHGVRVSGTITCDEFTTPVEDNGL